MHSSAHVASTFMKVTIFMLAMFFTGRPCPNQQFTTNMLVAHGHSYWRPMAAIASHSMITVPLMSEPISVNHS